MIQEAIEAALLAENSGRCDPPLPDAAVRRIAASVARYEPTQTDSEGKGHNFSLVSAAELISEAKTHSRWLWEGILPQGGLSLLVSKPKFGKTTFGINLGVAVSRGDHFLGRQTAQASVVYLALEEKREEVADKLKNLGVEQEPFHLGDSSKGSDREKFGLVSICG